MKNVLVEVKRKKYYLIDFILLFKINVFLESIVCFP